MEDGKIIDKIQCEATTLILNQLLLLSNHKTSPEETNIINST